MASGFKQGIQLTKTLIPMAAQSVNGVKEQVLPVLKQIEPLVAALEQAKTQEEFNVASANMEQAMLQQMSGIAGGVPGFDPSMSGPGTGSSSVSSHNAVTVIVNQELNDFQLKTLITKLESISDNPEEAILLPKLGAGETLIQMSPVDDFQGFVERISIADILDQNPAEKTVTVGLSSSFDR